MVKNNVNGIELKETWPFQLNFFVCRTTKVLSQYFECRITGKVVKLQYSSFIQPYALLFPRSFLFSPPPLFLPLFFFLFLIRFTQHEFRPGFRALSLPPVSRSILITSHCLKMPTRIYLLYCFFVGKITSEPFYACFCEIMLLYVNLEQR